MKSHICKSIDSCETQQKHFVSWVLEWSFDVFLIFNAFAVESENRSPRTALNGAIWFIFRCNG